MSTGPTFIAALRTEAFGVRLFAPGLRVSRFGIGAKAAEVTAQQLLRSAADPIVLLGFSGALDPTLRPGDVVVATELGLVGEDKTVALCDAEALAAELRGEIGRVLAAPIVTSRKLVYGDEARVKAAAGGAVAVDMESWYFAPLVDRGFAVVRAIVDVPGREVRSWSTPLAALHAARSLARAGRLVDRSTVVSGIRTNEHAGEI